MTNRRFILYNKLRLEKRPFYGGVAQLARACGSYPQCRWFDSNYRYHGAPNQERVHGPMVKRLRHRPFTAVSRVRFPFGSPFSHCVVLHLRLTEMRFGRIAQLVRALASHARGRRFESVCAHQKPSEISISLFSEGFLLLFNPKFGRLLSAVAADCRK